jgi:hypothetical protein
MCDNLSHSVTLPAIVFRETGNTETPGDRFSSESRPVKSAKPRKPGTLKSWHGFCYVLRTTKITNAMTQ